MYIHIYLSLSKYCDMYAMSILTIEQEVEYVKMTVIEIFQQKHGENLRDHIIYGFHGM